MDEIFLKPEICLLINKKHEFRFTARTKRTNLFTYNIVEKLLVDIYIYIYMYVCIYIYVYMCVCVCVYHTITDVYTTALLLTKPLSDDESRFRHGFGAEVSLPLAQSAPAVSHDTTRLCQIVVTLWDCQIHADAVRALYIYIYIYIYIYVFVCIYIYIYI